MENDLKGNENYFELTGGSCCRGFELPGVDCIVKYVWEKFYLLTVIHIKIKYSRLPIIRTSKGNRKKFELSRVNLYGK